MEGVLSVCRSMDVEAAEDSILRDEAEAIRMDWDLIVLSICVSGRTEVVVVVVVVGVTGWSYDIG